MEPRNDANSFAKQKEIPTNTVLNPEITLNLNENSLESPIAGDSVDEHKEPEGANSVFHDGPRNSE